jgi:positive regulator of sigma E activity
MLPSGEPGIITATDGDRITIQLTNQDACEDCGLQLVCKPGGSDDRSLEINSPGEFQVGQQVKLVEQINLEWRLASLQYLLPLLLFIAGILGFYMIPVSAIPVELLSFVGGCLGLVVSFLISRHLMARLAKGLATRALRVVSLSN